MSVNVTIAGTAYAVPTSGDVDWGAVLANYLQALANSGGPSVLQFGASLTPGDTTADFLRPGFMSGTADAGEAFLRVPLAGKVSALYVQARVAPGTQGQVLTVRKNGVNTTLAATIAAAATQAADTSHSFSVAAGDRISVQVQGVAGITSGARDLVITLLYSHQ